MAAVMREMAEIEKNRMRAAALRAGLITSAIYNVHRKKGSRKLKASDFIKKEREHMSVDEAAAYMDRWVEAHNERAEA